jgi:penicillin-binding protein 2
LASSYGERRSPSGRFLPPDPRVAEPYRFTPQLALRVGILGAIALAAFAILFLRLWALQVLSGDRYLVTALENQIRTVRTEAPRGPILDRHGRPLVTNVPGTVVQLWPADMPEQGRYRMVRRLATILRVPPSRITKAIEARKGDPLTPVTVRTAVPNDRALYLEEHRAEFRGVEVVTTFLRDYKHKSLAAQLLGHVGEISEQELATMQEEGYRLGDRIGKTGVEAAFDQYLRGTPGSAQLRVNSLGEPQSRLLPQQIWVPGNAVRLTLDIRLQRAAEQAITYGIQKAHENENWWANGGAVVALDPTDGEVLALASNPSYKPSIYVGRPNQRKIDALAAPERNFPLINRATSGRYPPGSTWKPVTALAAMQENILSPYQSIQCDPVRYYGDDRQAFRNWNPFVNEPMTLPTALAASCDTYFYEVGNRFFELPTRRGQPLQRWARTFGFGAPSGLDVGGEDGGLLPTYRWKRETYTKERYPKTWQVEQIWKPGDSIQLAIGQKDLLVTPLQMTRFYALLANGGRLVTPHLVSSVEQPGMAGRAPVVLQRFPPPPPLDTNVSADALAAVQEGLRDATTASYGTSSGVFGSFPVPISGKTGTAEKVVDGALRDQSWWCGYGPSWGGKSPIALCVLIENGGFGGEAAAPAALKVLEAHYGVRANVISEVPSD